MKKLLVLVSIAAFLVGGITVKRGPAVPAHNRFFAKFGAQDGGGIASVPGCLMVYDFGATLADCTAGFDYDAIWTLPPGTYQPISLSGVLNGNTDTGNSQDCDVTLAVGQIAGAIATEYTAAPLVMGASNTDFDAQGEYDSVDMTGQSEFTIDGAGSGDGIYVVLRDNAPGTCGTASSTAQLHVTVELVKVND